MKNIEMTAVFELCDEGGFIAYVQEIWPAIDKQDRQHWISKVRWRLIFRAFFPPHPLSRPKTEV